MEQVLRKSKNKGTVEEKEVVTQEIAAENIETGIELADQPGIAMSPNLRRVFTKDDATQIAVWAYDNAVLEALKLLIDALSELLSDPETADSQRSYIFMLGVKGGFDLINGIYEKMDKEALRAAIALHVEQFSLDR